MTERCTMDVGCGETGQCYAEAHGQPERCPNASSAPAIEREGVSLEGLAQSIANIADQFKRIATRHPSDQPAYKNGVRPFGTGDLRHFIETLDAAVLALSPSPTIERDADDLRHKLWMIVSHATGGNCPTIEGIERSTNDICCDISRFRNILYQDGKDVGKREAYERAAWPRLTNAMIDAACVAHYGKNRVSAAGGADGVDMAVDSHDYSFRQAFRRMWPAMKRAALIPSGDDREDG